MLGRDSPTTINSSVKSRECLPNDQRRRELGFERKENLRKNILFLKDEIKYTHIYTKDLRVDSTYDPGKNQQRKFGKELIVRSTQNR